MKKHPMEIYQALYPQIKTKKQSMSETSDNIPLA